MIELYHWEPVSHSLRVLICLNEIGVEYKSTYVDLLEFDQFADDILTKNRTGQVPILENNGVTMCESALITEYLAEAFPDAGLASTDPLGWYNTQTWSKYVDYNLSSSLATLGCQKYLAPLLKRRASTALRQRVDSIPVVQRRSGWRMAISGDYPAELLTNSERKVGLVVGRMEGILEKSEWLVGDDYSIADINTMPFIHGLRDVAPNIINAENAPNTEAWHERIVARPAVKKALAKGIKFEPGTVYAPGPEHSRWG